MSYIKAFCPFNLAVKRAGVSDSGPGRWNVPLEDEILSS